MLKLMKYELRKTAFSKLVLLVITAVAELAFLLGVFLKKDNLLAIGIVFLFMCAVFGAYFCCFVRMKLSRFYDENNVNIFYDGPFRMHVPGVNFNNRNWPHIVQALRLSLCLNMILLPILNLLISSMAVAVWENIGKYVFLAIMLCSVFLPIYVVGKKYE